MNATGAFSANLTGLSANTTYHFRAKAVGDGTSYGAEKSFITLSPEVRIDAPARVAPGSTFTASVNIIQVANLDAASYIVSVNATVLRLLNVTSGSIGDVVIPVDMWNADNTTPGRYAIVQNYPGVGGVSGSGYLACLHFQVIGTTGQVSPINLSNGMLSNILAEEIPATWIGASVAVNIVPGDTTGDGKVDARDITKVERIIVRLDPPTSGADANQDGKIDALDITKVERIIVWLD